MSKSDPPPSKIRFVISGVPVAKGRPRFVCRNGFPQTFSPQTTIAYEKLVKAHALAAAKKEGWAWHEDEWYRVGLVVYRARALGDADNFCKAVLDGCNKILWEDDRYVVDLWIKVDDSDKKNARVEVTVEKIKR